MSFNQSNTITTSNNQAIALEQVLLGGDLARLTPEQKVVYYNRVCESLGLNPLTKPFAYIKLNGKEVLYASRDATDQLRNKRQVSIKITAREKFDDIFQVTAQATTPDGRTDESIGAVNLAGLRGEGLANAVMKAETKAKRRVTLSICGLGMLDETEVQSIEGATESSAISHSTQSTRHRETATGSYISPGTGTITTAAIHAPGRELERPQITHVIAQTDPGDWPITFGKKFIGKRFRDVPMSELVNYRDWMRVSSEKDKKPLSGKALQFSDDLDAYQAFMKNQADKKLPEYDKGYQHPEEYNGPPMDEPNLPF